MVTKIATRDLYEAAYMLMNGCSLEKIQGSQVNGKVICNLVFTGDDISQLQIIYLNGQATANILQLRRTVGQINSWVYSAKRDFKKQLQNSEGGQA